MAGLERHHNFFERCIARAFANAVDGHFSLTRARLNSSQRIRGCHAEIIMAMHRNGNAIVHAGRVPDNTIDQFEIFIGRGVANRVGNVKRCRARLDRFAQNNI